MNSIPATYEQAAIVARKYALARGHGPNDKAGAEVLVAGIAKAIGEGVALPVLGALGVEDPQGFLKAIPAVEPEEVQNLPSLEPDAHLMALLKGELAGLRKGSLALTDALRILLSPENLTCGTRCALGIKEDPEVSAPQTYDMRNMVRRLAGVYQKRFLLGRAYLEEKDKTGHVDFVTGGRDDAFSRAYRELLEEERNTFKEVFTGAAYRHSPLGSARAKYGERCAHILGALLLNEMGLVGDGLMLVRELAYLVEPKRFYLVAGTVCKDVCRLADAELVEVCPEEDKVHLFSKVLVAPPLLSDFLDYLHQHAEITQDEVDDFQWLLA